MSQKIEWRQQLQSYGIAHSINIDTERKIENWLLEEFQFMNKPHWKLFRFILPAISFALLTLHLIDIIPSDDILPINISDACNFIWHFQIGNACIYKTE